MMPDEPITEDWLREVGFKWHQLDRQPAKQWLLWLADCFRQRGNMVDTEDLGIELAPAWWFGQTGMLCGSENEWYCWIRGDTSGRYRRFIHIRHLRTKHELIRLIEALTGQCWDAANIINGSMTTPENAARYRAEADRLDRRILRDSKWGEVEKDDSMGGALPEHLEAHEKAKAK